MISCRYAAWLSSQSLDRPLTTFESVLLKAHLFLCSECDGVDRQLKWMRRNAADLGGYLETGDAALPTLPESARQRIADAIGKETT